jgi:hypothetical protein
MKFIKFEILDVQQARNRNKSLIEKQKTYNTKIECLEIGNYAAKSKEARECLINKRLMSEIE